MPITKVLMEGVLMPNGEIVSFGHVVGRIVVDPADLAYNTEATCPVIGYDNFEPQMVLFRR